MRSAILCLTLAFSCVQVSAETPPGPHQSASGVGVPIEGQGDETVFSNLYSRPNDDTFQNAAGNAGVPYEVAKIRCAVVAKKEGGGFTLAFDWSAEMTTGRHVEAGNYFLLTDTGSNLKSRPRDIDKPLGIKYPTGASVESLPQKKVGSLLYSRIDMGRTEGDGTFEGKLVVRRGEKLGLGAGVSHFNEAGPKTGVFQLISWKVEVKDGKIGSPQIECKRGKEPQLRRVASSYDKIDTSRPEHQPYPPQPKGAACKEEKVGEGESSTEERVHVVRLAKEFGGAVKAAGCLDCHGEGNGDNQLFCDDGTPVNPTTTYRSIQAFLDPKFDWTVKTPDGQLRYPKGMNSCYDSLREELRTEGLAKLKNLIESIR